VITRGVLKTGKGQVKTAQDLTFPFSWCGIGVFMRGRDRRWAVNCLCIQSHRCRWMTSWWGWHLVFTRGGNPP